MRLVVQRVLSAAVSVGPQRVARIERGLVVFVGITHGDTAAIILKLAAKVTALRIFEDAAGKMNLRCADIGGSVLCISQFTLYGDTRRGNRPSFTEAATRDVAQPLYEAFCEEIERLGLVCGRGVFGAEMRVELVSDGPMTLILDSDDFEKPRRT